MLLTDNIAFRLREWFDRESDEPDLVPRLRRLWAQQGLPPAPEKTTSRSSAAPIQRQPALEARPGA